jgi:RNA polymerase sigma-70 factor (ECF subfamily)
MLDTERNAILQGWIQAHKLMLDGFSYRDMSQVLGLTESNVGVRINRIKAALAAQLAKEESDEL